MARVSHLWTLWSLLLFVETSLCANFIREIGTETNISCAFKKSERHTQWQVRAGQDFIAVSSCTFGRNICRDHMPQQYHGEVETNKDGFTSRLIINSVRINETEFRCLGRRRVVTTTLEVYALPSNPFCDPVTLDYTNKYLHFRCEATKVFPSIFADLVIEGDTDHHIHTVRCNNHESGSLIMDGYSAECFWDMLESDFKSVKYKYYVQMYPDLSHMTTGNIGLYAVSQDYTFQLSSPVAVIDYKSCPIGTGVVDGKIITGSKASCRCVLESPGFPPGQARWYTVYGNDSLGRDDTVDGSSTLEIYPNIQGQSYQCRAESPLKNSLNWGPLYTPVFTTPSSGPETYSLRIEIVAGLLAGSIALTAVIAIVIWKWRSRKRQNRDTTSVVYSRPSEDAQSDSGKAECSGEYSILVF